MIRIGTFFSIFESPVRDKDMFHFLAVVWFLPEGRTQRGALESGWEWLGFAPSDGGPRDQIYTDTSALIVQLHDDRGVSPLTINRTTC